jgi:CPA2 family monovalent cation:H+ antiporter-2
MEFGLLRDIIIIFSLSIFVIFVFLKIKVPAIIGFLFTGLITGPHGLQLIKDTHDVEVLAEIGIILLLFTIGIEFSLKSLLKASRSVLIGGAMQVGLVILATYYIARLTGAQKNESIFLGFLVALSSTALVMKIIQSRGELGTLHGNTSLAILIFQDIIIIPMILVTQLLAGSYDNGGDTWVIILLKGVGLLGFIILGAKILVPKLLYLIARTKSRELFLLTIIVIGFATAWLTSEAGLSLALGAFIAGLIISESEYSDQAFGNIIPFRDLFTSFFFVSVGMLLDIRFVIEYPILVFATALGLILLKTLISGFVAFILGFPFRTTVIVGLTLSQIGEFSFILSEYGIRFELLSPFNYQLFLSSAVLTLSATPFIINAAPHIAEFILKRRIPSKLRYGLRNLTESVDSKLEKHLIIIGFGINGQNVARAAKFANIAHVIIELNPDTVKAQNAKGKIIHYGDATQEGILLHAGIEHASILVVTIPHPADTRLIVQKAKSLNPDVHIIIRTRYIQDVMELYALGADEVVPEEFETSIEIFTRVLLKYKVPVDEIEDLVSIVRTDGYQLFRTHSLQDQTFRKLGVKIPETELHSIQIKRELGLIGKSLADCKFMDYHITFLALVRDQQIFSKIEPSILFKENDILFFLGSIRDFKEMSKI